MDPKLKVTIER